MIRIIKSRIDGTEIRLNIEENRRYGMMLSGGIDSGILLYLLLKAHGELGWKPNIQPFVMLKKNEMVQSSAAMVNYINTQFPYDLPQPIEVGNPDIHHRDQGEAAWREISRKYPAIDYVFYASNATPTWDYSRWPKDAQGNPIGRPERSKGEGGMVWLPFLHLYKFHTVDLVFEHNQEEMFRLARSCTQHISGPRCGKCFHCRERAWGFACVSRDDPGIG